MTVYEEVIRYQKALIEDFKTDLTVFESLHIACKMVSIKTQIDSFAIYDDESPSGKTSILEDLVRVIRELGKQISDNNASKTA